MASFGKRTAGSALTPAEKSAKKNSSYNKLAEVIQAGVYKGNNNFVKLWEASVSKLRLATDKDGTYLQYNHGTDEKPMWGEECYIGLGTFSYMTKGIGDVFTKDKEAEAKNPTTDFTKYHHRVTFIMGMPLNKSITDFNKQADEQVAKSITYWEARKEFLIKSAMGTANAFAELSDSCKTLVDGMDNATDADREKQFAIFFEKGINFGSKMEKYEEEETKIQRKILTMNVKTQSFGKNFNDKPLPEEIVEETKHNNPSRKFICNMIKNAHKEGSYPFKWNIQDVNGSPITYSFFDYAPITSGTIGLLSFKVSHFDKSADKVGFTVRPSNIVPLSTVHMVQQSGDVGEYKYFAPKPRPALEISILSLLKESQTGEDGVSSTVLAKKLLDEKKVDKNKMVEALAALLHDDMIAHGKDASHFVFKYKELDISRIPVLVTEHETVDKGNNNVSA